VAFALPFNVTFRTILVFYIFVLASLIFDKNAVPVNTRAHAFLASWRCIVKFDRFKPSLIRKIKPD